MQKNSKEITIEIPFANKVALYATIPLLVLYVFPFILIFGWSSFSSELLFFAKTGLIIIIAGVPLHEGLHALGWAVFTPKPWKNISFGIQWKYLAPYTHCKLSLKPYQYIIGGILPLLVMGFLPLIIGYYSESSYFVLTGFIFTWVAFGDILSVYTLAKERNLKKVKDHPEKLGFIVEYKEEKH